MTFTFKSEVPPDPCGVSVVHIVGVVVAAVVIVAVVVVPVVRVTAVTVSVVVVVVVVSFVGSPYTATEAERCSKP
jgi:hypothetical protein